MARETGLEPATSGVTGRRSNQLSYSRAIAKPAESRDLKGPTFEVKDNEMPCGKSVCPPSPGSNSRTGAAPEPREPSKLAQP